MRQVDAEVLSVLPDVERAVEIGIGDRPGLAEALASRGVTVIATDVRARTVPETVRFVRDDLTAPDQSLYAEAELLYARRLPPELHRPAADLAERAGAWLYFTTLGFEAPEIPVEPVPVGNATWYRASGIQPPDP